MISDIQYSKASLRDENAVIKLHALLYADDNIKTTEEISKAVHEALINRLLWVAKVDEEVVGYILCQLFDEKHRYFPNSIFIDGLFVLDENRRQGVGKNLIESVLRDEYPKPYYYFSVTHDPVSVQLTEFYKSFGFIASGVTGAGNIMMKRNR